MKTLEIIKIVQRVEARFRLVSLQFRRVSGQIRRVSITFPRVSFKPNERYGHDGPSGHITAMQVIRALHERGREKDTLLPLSYRRASPPSFRELIQYSVVREQTCAVAWAKQKHISTITM